MERHRCKLCFRHFANGRALGGHMRSHVMNDYQLKKGSKADEELEEEQQLFDENLERDYEEFQSVHSYATTSEEEEEDDEDPNKSPGSMDPEYSVSVVLQDRESETESSKKNPVSRRSKRIRNPRVSDFCMNGVFEVKRSKFGSEEQSKVDEKMENYEPLSSISETSTEEDVAHCLIMMSKDKWDKEEIEYDEEEEVEVEVGDDYSQDSGVEKVIKSSSKVRGKYRCDTCNKLFRSYQALGGHRASHKKIKVNTAAPSQKAVVGGSKVHECPFCHRVFASGQALGGHKRSHFITTWSPVKEVPRVVETFNIDLNLPAPIDDEDQITHVVCPIEE